MAIGDVLPIVTFMMVPRHQQPVEKEHLNNVIRYTTVVTQRENFTTANEWLNFPRVVVSGTLKAIPAHATTW